MNSKSSWLLACALLVTLAAVSLAKDKQDDAKDREHAMKSLGMAKLSAVEAIQTGMKKVPNGKAVQVGLHMENDRPLFLVEIVDSNGKHMELNIDAISGMPSQVVEEKKTSKKSDDEKAEDDTAKGKVTLVQAIETVRQEMPNAKVYKACSENEDGKVVFAIELLSGDKIAHAQVDSDTGKVIDKKNAK
jgi:uncharacterized membrane protein YkoI